MTVRKYSTAAAFKQALEQRLRTVSGSGPDFARRRQLVVFDRFRAECRLAGKVYGRSFGVDVAFGDPIFGEPESIVAEDVLGFAGIAPPTIRVYPVETHIAEKLRAYTMPRDRLNSRVKDLPDLALIATVGQLEARSLRAAIDQTFSFRGTHGVPHRLPVPPKLWDGALCVHREG